MKRIPLIAIMSISMFANAAFAQQSAAKPGSEEHDSLPRSGSSLKC